MSEKFGEDVKTRLLLKHFYNIFIGILNFSSIFFLFVELFEFLINFVARHGLLESVKILTHRRFNTNCIICAANNLSKINVAK